jgi:drug/metabolite transporter (DMT)-like permease
MPVQPATAPDTVRPHAGVYLQLVTTTALWGSAFVASKVATQAVPATVAAAVRFGLAAIFMGLFLLTRPREERRLPAGTGRYVAILGTLGVAIYNLCFFLGLAFSRASDGSMIIPTTSPMVTTVLASLFLREPLTRRKLGGLGLSLAGSLLFFYTVVTSGPVNGKRVVGDLLFVLAAISWAGFTLLGKRVLQRINPLVANTYALLVGSTILLAIALPEAMRVDWASVGWSFWAIEVYLSLFPTALANVFWYNGVSRIGASRTAVFMYLVPVTGLILSALLLHDLPAPLQLAGAALMIGGVWVATR